MADIYRQVYTSFWQDSFVLTLTPEEKYFYLYLITNSKTSLCGIYELPIKIIEFETGYNRETVEKLIHKFEEYKKIKYSYDTNEICVCNFMKYNVNRSPKVRTAVNKAFDDVKDENLIRYIYGIDTISSVTDTVTVTVTDTVTEQDNNSKQSKTPARKKYGEYNHVLLTDEQYQKLIADYSADKITEYIKKIDEYCQQYGKSYKDYNLTIRKWILSDNQKKPERNYEIVPDKEGKIF